MDIMQKYIFLLAIIFISLQVMNCKQEENHSDSYNSANLQYTKSNDDSNFQYTIQKPKNIPNQYEVPAEDAKIDTSKIESKTIKIEKGMPIYQDKRYTSNDLKGMPETEVKYLRYSMYKKSEYGYLMDEWLDTYLIEKLGGQHKFERDRIALGANGSANESLFLNYEAEKRKQEQIYITQQFYSFKIFNQIRYDYNLASFYLNVKDISKTKFIGEETFEQGILIPEFSEKLTLDEWLTLYKGKTSFSELARFKNYGNPPSQIYAVRYYDFNKTKIELFVSVKYFAGTLYNSSYGRFHIYDRDSNLIRTVDYYEGDRWQEYDYHYYQGELNKIVHRTFLNSKLVELEFFTVIK